MQLLGLWITLGVVILLLTLFFTLVPFKTWFNALVSGTYISMFRLIGMRFRKVDVRGIVEQYILARKAGVTISIDEIETHSMAGGNIVKVIGAMIAAVSAPQIELSLELAKAIDLSGRDVLQSVRDSIIPVVIETPTISASCQDGIEIKVKARATLKTNLTKIIGGAGEETILARIGEGIVTAVGASDSHKIILERPDIISKTVLKIGLDDGTVYDIISLDIADIDMGRNLGAELSIQQAEAEKQIAQSKAEERRSQAVAAEYEMRAKAQEMRAVVLAAESEVPKAIAEAFRKGKLGIMDYYRMQNTIADTNMRNSFSRDDSSDKPE